MSNEKKRESGSIRPLDNEEAVVGGSPLKRRKNLQGILGQPVVATTPGVNNASATVETDPVIRPAGKKKDLGKHYGTTQVEVPAASSENKISEVSFSVAEVVTEPVRKKAHVVGTAILYGFKEEKETEYQQNIEGQLRGTNLSARKLDITTNDGTPIEGLHIIANPKSDKTIVVFQGQRGNYQSVEQLERLIYLAKRSGQNVVAYNYRRTLDSIDTFEKDASVVCDYVFKAIDKNTNNVTLYGESLGGAVAARTAARLKAEEKDVKVILVRTPKSLIQALQSLLERVPLIARPIIKLAQPLLNKFGDLDPETDIRSLNANNVRTIALKNDNFFGENSAQSKNPENHIICVPKEHITDPHNADPSQLRVLATTGEPKKAVMNGREVTVTAFDELLEFCNPRVNSAPAQARNDSTPTTDQDSPRRAGWTRRVTTRGVTPGEWAEQTVHMSDKPTLPDDTSIAEDPVASQTAQSSQKK